jgi:hypothetical protein
MRIPLALTSLSLLVLAAGAASAGDDGFRPIFDGKSLEGWDGNTEVWRVENGAIVGQTTAEKPTKGNTFLVWRKGEPSDFELVLEFRMTGGNSGIQVRSFENPAEWGKWVIGGYQADIDSGNTFTGALYGERYRGMLAERGQKTVIGDDGKPRVVGSTGDPKEIASKVKAGDWNEYRIEAKGNAIKLAINGVSTSECVDEDRKAAKASGLIALQVHAGPPMKIEFRNIRLRSIAGEGKKKVVLVAGQDSHGAGSHAHGAGCDLLAKCLNESGLPVEAKVYKGGWPTDPAAFDGAAAIAVYCDGGGGHPILPHIDEVDALAKKGVGVGFIHYGVEVPVGKPGEKFMDWTGGYYEVWWSVNPFWKADFVKLPDHPVARGVKPFQMEDEWYFNMRFSGFVTPILEAVPPDEVRNRPDDAHGGNSYVRSRKGQSEILLWVRERRDGGRGFGFTGGHNHRNWGDENFRKAVLNAIAWTAKVDVPAGGVPSKVAPEDLQPKPRR